MWAFCLWHFGALQRHCDSDDDGDDVEYDDDDDDDDDDSVLWFAL